MTRLGRFHYTDPSGLGNAEAIQYMRIPREAAIRRGRLHGLLSKPSNTHGGHDEPAKTHHFLLGMLS